MIKVSVVIPVYNNEKYLDTCVKSLMNQTLEEIELIFVDDGSEDHSFCGSRVQFFQSARF